MSETPALSADSSEFDKSGSRRRLVMPAFIMGSTLVHLAMCLVWQWGWRVGIPYPIRDFVTTWAQNIELIFPYTLYQAIGMAMAVANIERHSLDLEHAISLVGELAGAALLSYFLWKRKPTGRTFAMDMARCFAGLVFAGLVISAWEAWAFMHWFK